LILTMLGTVSGRKRQNWGMHALRHLHDRGIQAVLLIVGTSFIKPTFNLKQTQFVEEIKTGYDNPFVRFIPTTLCSKEVLLLSDLHLSSSVSEAFPLNVIEAMQLGIPVIATDVGGTGEQFTKKETSWMLVKDKHNMIAFVEAVYFAATLRPEHRQYLGRVNINTADSVHEDFSRV